MRNFKLLWLLLELDLCYTREKSYIWTAPIIRTTIEQLGFTGSHSDHGTDHQKHTNLQSHFIVCTVFFISNGTFFVSLYSGEKFEIRFKSNLPSYYIMFQLNLAKTRDFWAQHEQRGNLPKTTTPPCFQERIFPKFDFHVKIEAVILF